MTIFPHPIITNIGVVRKDRDSKINPFKYLLFLILIEEMYVFFAPFKSGKYVKIRREGTVGNVWIHMLNSQTNNVIIIIIIGATLKQSYKIYHFVFLFTVIAYKWIRFSFHALEFCWSFTKNTTHCHLTLWRYSRAVFNHIHLIASELKNVAKKPSGILRVVQITLVQRFGRPTMWPPVCYKNAFRIL